MNDLIGALAAEFTLTPFAALDALRVEMEKQTDSIDLAEAAARAGYTHLYSLGPPGALESLERIPLGREEEPLADAAATFPLLFDSGGLLWGVLLKPHAADGDELLRAVFRALSGGCNIARLSRESGYSERGLHAKRRGEAPVREWDLWALAWYLTAQLG